MSKVARSAAAKDDLRHHAKLIARHSPKAARRFLDAMKDAFQLLARFPEMGPHCEFQNPNAANLRYWAPTATPLHVIVYRPIEKGIEVVRVLLGSRDWQRRFDLPNDNS